MAKISESYPPGSAVTTGHLFLLIGIAILLGAVAAMVFVPLSAYIVPDKVYQGFLSGALVSLFSFLLAPVVLKGFFAAKREPFYLRFARPALTLTRTGQALVVMLLMIPTVSLLSLAMSCVPLPEALKPVQEAVEAQTMLFLNESRPAGIILALLFLAIVAPLSEECFFRGGLMGWGLAKAGKPHLWVWLVALIFALAHFEWIGLPARFFMGAVLGYVALYGGLPMAVMTHAFNNLFVYLFYKFTGLQDPFFSSPESLTLPRFAFLLFAAAVTLSALIFLLKKLSSSK